MPSMTIHIRGGSSIVLEWEDPADLRKHFDLAEKIHSRRSDPKQGVQVLLGSSQHHFFPSEVVHIEFRDLPESTRLELPDLTNTVFL